MPGKHPTEPRRRRTLWRRPLWLAAALALPVGTIATAAEVTVRVVGVMPAAGRVYVSLCSPSLAPSDCGNAQVLAADAPDLAARFPDVAPGVYAAAAFQDLNGDGTLDRSPRGLPREPYGLSREAGRNAAPRFDRAAFPVDRDTVVTIRLAGPGRP